MNEERIFSPEYNLGNQTQTDIPKDVVKPKEGIEYKIDIDTKHYDISKPKRILIKAKIIND